MIRSSWAISVVIAIGFALVLVAPVASMGPIVPPSAAEVDSLPVGASSRESTPLGQPAPSATAPDERAASAPSGNGWLLRSMLGLGVVLGLALLLRILVGNMSARSGSIRSQLGAGGRAPSGIIEVLARYPIARSQTLVLLRVDKRVLLLSQGANGFSPLSEINDAESVASIISQANDDAGESMTARFNDMLRQVEQSPAPEGPAPVHQARQAARSAQDDAVGKALAQMRGVSA